MIKKILLPVLLLFTFYGFSQISVSARHAAGVKKIKDETFKRFKNTKTIFILSKIFKKEEYEKILNESWKITPFEVVEADSFNYKDYLNDNYSFVDINTISATVQRTSLTAGYLFFNLDLFMYKNDKVLKKLSKLKNNIKEDKKRRKVNDILFENRIDLSRIYLFPNGNKLKKIIKESGMKFGTRFNDNSVSEEDFFMNLIYSKNIFNNYTLGHLKNYFQKINNILINNETYWFYEDEYLPELNKLASNKLHIPKYIGNKFNGFNGDDNNKGEERIKELLKKYEYDYEIITTEELDTKILENNEIYYLRYVRMNTERFLQVVNSKTGEVVYRDYIPGMSYNLKSKQFKELNKAIKKSLKN